MAVRHGLRLYSLMIVRCVSSACVHRRKPRLDRRHAQRLCNRRRRRDLNQDQLRQRSEQDQRDQSCRRVSRIFNRRERRADDRAD